jgi:ribosome assembly protein RRB1
MSKSSKKRGISGAPVMGSKRSTGRSNQQEEETDEMVIEENGLEFEDPYGDEFEEESLEDNEVIDEEEIEEIEANEAEAAALAEEQQANTNHPSTNLPPKQVWRPGIDKLPEGEELEYDPSAYIMYHAMRTEWPCLSFDILRDIYGDNRLRVSNIAFSDK